MKQKLIFLVAAVCLAGVAHADVVNLKNGDRVTGTLIRVDGGTLELKSDIMGKVSIPLAKVASYSVEKPVAVIIKGQEPLQGAVEMTPQGDWQVKSDGKVQVVPAPTVATIIPAADYRKVEGAPKIWQAWKGNASLGESIQRGNQDTNTFTTTITAVHERPATPLFERHMRTNFGLTTLLSHANETGSSATITSHTLSTNVREDFLFSPRTFVFALTQFDHISTEGLYLRQTYGGGFGRDVIKNSRRTFSLIGGLTYQSQKFFNGDSDRTANGLLGEKFSQQFSKRVHLDHILNFYPNFTQGGQYRFDTTTTLAVKLNDRFFLNTGVIDLYLSNPPAGNQKNNLTFTTGIGYTF